MKKAVLITGASSGIGQATALEFSRQGYFIYLMGRNKERLEETALRCCAGACLLSCDLKYPAQVEKRLNEIYENPLYRLEILINNAGVFKTHSMEEGSDEIWTEQFETNLLGPVRLTRLLIPYFKKYQKGSIVNISSTLGLRPSSNTGAYSALKAALINWTQSLAQEAGAYGVRVNCICPGIVDTPIHSFNNLPESQKQKVLEEMAKLQPLGRIGTPEDLAKSVYFIGSELSAWTTGAVLSVDGGIYLQ
ncbi:MAG TPA: SDR family oxidoreductase [Pseudobdellovibrionaceae bacterium]|jgi:NAD(P)-dependent dehydrogenase (short-subunit alcohol dehydrogenase family)